MKKQRQERGTVERLAHARRVLAHCEAATAAQAARRVLVRAAATTRTVISRANDAEAALAQVTRACAVNESGVFSDPLVREADLLAARQAVDKAIASIAAAKWPTHSDYKKF